MTHGSLFSGIGGFDLAAEWMQWENVFHCEWNKFGQRVLKHYWPQSISYEDITKTDFTIHSGQIDVLTGGFPCQPYSTAGKRHGKDDERHLWPEMLRAIREIQPRWVVGENVRGLVNWNGGMVFDEVQSDLEAQGYEVQPFILPGCAKDAPHRRDRVWFVAYNNNRNGKEIRFQTGRQEHLDGDEGERTTSDTASNGQHDEPTTGNNTFGPDNIEPRTQRERTAKGFGDERTTSDAMRQRGRKNNGEGKSRFLDKTFPDYYWQNFPAQSPICGGDDGLPSELDGITFPKWRNESIKAYGNAVVPQVVHEIFKAIESYDHTRTKTNH